MQVSPLRSQASQATNTPAPRSAGKLTVRSALRYYYYYHYYDYFDYYYY